MQEAERANSLEFPFKMHENFVLNVTGADGIEIEFDREPLKVSLLDGSSDFEYLVSENQNKKEVRALIKVNETSLPVANHTAMKAYFEQVSDLVQKGIVVAR